MGLRLVSSESPEPSRVRVIDSHTGGEPTRVVVDGGPELGPGTLGQRAELLRSRLDGFCRAVVDEPRGSPSMVGALLCRPDRAGSLSGVVFFDRKGPLGMCGHGTIGVLVTLAHLGRIAAGACTLDTPVGEVRAWYHPEGDVSFENVESYRLERARSVDTPGYGPLSGDVAWGGNWFFIVEAPPVPLVPERIPQLLTLSRAIRDALRGEGVSGKDGAPIDHILLHRSTPEEHGSRNFVLCPSDTYDRSPCGTGTSALLACLSAEGRFRPGELWRQESITGSVFEGSVAIRDGRVFPRIRGSAYVTGETTLIFHPADPWREGPA